MKKYILLLLIGLAANANPTLEARTQALSQNLRCPVCAGQSLWDSQTPMARDIQSVIYQKLEAGLTDDEVIAFLHTRYGDAIYLKPPVTARTYFLWIFPFLCLLGAGLMIAFHIHKRRC